MRSGFKLGGIFSVECFDKRGSLLWEDEAKNLVVNAGIQHILDLVFTGAAIQISTWYIGLTAASPTPAPEDALAVHAGWTEFASYSGTRQAYVETRTSQQLSNAASRASFSITSDGSTIGGLFLCSVASGTSGTLMSAAPFTGGNKSADNGDTLLVTYTFSGADDGV